MATAADPAAKQQCVNCNKPAALTCSRCKDSVYCDAACQKADWRAHKTMCNIVNIDQTVHRAGALLQKLLLIWCEKALTDNISSIEDTGSRLLIRNHNSVPCGFYSFPAHLVANEAQKHMVLTASQCIAFIAYFSDILAQMLRGTSLKVETTTLRLKQPSKTAIKMNESLRKDRPLPAHCVFQVTSASDKQKWFLDASGAQFGIYTACAHAEVYTAQHVDVVLSIAPVTLAKDLYAKLCASPGLLGFSQAQRRDGMRAVQMGINVWTAERGTSLANLLRLPEKDFAGAEKELLGMVGKAVQGFVVLWDREAEVYALMQRSFAQQIEDAEEMSRLFDEYARRTEPYEVWTAGKIVICV